ncbi:N-acetylmuramoyl-L-alanine amidase [Prolixibacteraceae bacterium JC049]|nr:N-acetylmuramoyl-L-alanine amidase [Prolixibacteraceae bacterium JC049]
MNYKTIALIVSLIFSIGICHSQNSNKTVKAKKGEGVYSLLKRNGLSPSEHLNDFIKLNKGKLGKNNALIVGRTYYLPSTPAAVASSRSYSIFGKKYAKINPKSSKLKGMVYYLVSGHGGPDPGAVGRYGKYKLCEDEYAYDVTLRLAHNLMEHGALVYMITRDPNDGIRDSKILKPDKDEVCYPKLRIPLNHIARLRQRKNAVNKLYKKHKGKRQRAIIIHVDSRSKRQNIDVFFYYDKRSKVGRKLASNLLNTFNQKYRKHQPGRGYEGSISSRNLYVLKHTYPPATFIELGNINHSRDRKRFLQKENRMALANWLTDGILLDASNNK